jgi:hypothetical protein
MIAIVLCQPVAYLILTYSDVKEIWDRLVSVYEQSIIQRLILLMTELFKLQLDSQMANVAYVGKVEMQFSDLNTELRRRGSQDISNEL